MSWEIVLYLHVAANDCDLHHNPENKTWYLGIIFMAHFSKMFACDQTERKQHVGLQNNQKFPFRPIIIIFIIITKVSLPSIGQVQHTLFL